MTSGQWTVLTILLITGAIELLFSPLTGKAFLQVSQGKPPIDPTQPIADQLAAPAISTLGWVVGAILLLLLAAPFPKVSTGFSLLILSLVVLRYGDKAASLLSTAGKH